MIILSWCRERIRAFDELDAFVLSFFFASRRRHTRSKRDWSSDVCSSDLAAEILIGMYMAEQPVFRLHVTAELSINIAAAGKDPRSEERRVGKEGGARGGGEAEREKGVESRDV